MITRAQLSHYRLAHPVYKKKTEDKADNCLLLAPGRLFDGMQLVSISDTWGLWTRGVSR